MASKMVDVGGPGGSCNGEDPVTAQPPEVDDQIAGI